MNLKRLIAGALIPILTACLLVALCISSLMSDVIAQEIEPRALTVQQGSVTAWPRKSKRFAIVVGVDEYQDKQITRLDGGSNDAKMLSDALIEFGGFPPEHVFLFASDQTSDRQPNRANILRRLANLRSLVPKDGLLLISFSGHGIERNGQAYLLASDSQVGDDLALLEQTAINANVIRE